MPSRKLTTTDSLSSGPTLLPSSVANFVSKFTKSTSLSIWLGALIGSTVLESARAGTLTSLELSRAAMEGIVRRGSRDAIAVRTGGGAGGDARQVEGWACKGLDYVNSSISLTELLVATAFELSQTTLAAVSGLAESYLATVDAVFGSTETSRAIHEIVKLIRTEFKESAEHDGEVGMKDIVAGLTCFAILQYRTKARHEQAWGEVMWDVVVDVQEMLEEPERDEDNGAGLVGRTTEDRGEEPALLPPILFDKLPPGAEVSVSTARTVTTTTTIEVIGASAPDFTPPPGAVVLSESEHHDGRQRYKIVYESVTRSEDCKKLKREDDGDDVLEMMDVDRGRLFEMDDSPSPPPPPPQLAIEAAGKQQKHLLPSAEKDVVAFEKKTRSSSQRNVEANQPRKRERVATSTSSKRKTKDGERERDKDKDKDRSVARAFKKALAPGVLKLDSKTSSRPSKNDVVVIPNRTSSTPQSAPPNPPRERKSSISGQASPDIHYSRSTRHHRRTASYSSSNYTPQRHSQSSLSRPASSLSLYSNDGEHSIRRAPSIYTLHTSHSSSSLHLLYNTPTPSNLGSYFPPQPHILENLRKYLRFAAASYGSHFMRFLFGSTFTPLTTADHHPLEHRAFSFHTSLPVDTILLSSHYDPSGGFDSAGHTGTGRPLVHFVCLDHVASAIVVTCRGTLGLEDVLTDLSCDYTTLHLRGSAFRVHKGMLASATLLLRSRLLSTLAAALAQHPTYGLILTGHSLGAGVAALASILISAPVPDTATFVTSHPSLPPGRPVHCYAFGPPAAVCSRLRRATRPLITTVVNDMDIVPSLSIGMVRDFHSVAVAFRDDTGDVVKEVRRRFLHGLWRRSHTDHETHWELAVIKTLRAGMTAEKLVPPGEVWAIACRTGALDTKKGGVPTPKMRVTAEIVNDVEGRFGELRFGRGVFADHSPAAYETTLEGLVRGVCCGGGGN